MVVHILGAGADSGAPTTPDPHLEGVVSGSGGSRALNPDKLHPSFKFALCATLHKVEVWSPKEVVPTRPWFCPWSDTEFGADVQQHQLRCRHEIWSLTSLHCFSDC